MKGKRNTIVVLVLAAALLTLLTAGWIATRGLIGRAEETGTTRPPEPRIVLSGYVDLEEGVALLNPLQPGRIDEVLVTENQPLSAGAALLRLDDRLARWKLDEAEAGLRAAQVKLAQAREAILLHESRLDQQKEAVDAAEKRLADAKDVLGPGIVKQAEAALRVERKKLDTLQKVDPTLDIKLAEANLMAAAATRDQAQFALEECTLRAPARGAVLRLNVHAGDVLGPMPQDPAIVFGVGHKRIVRFHVEQEFAEQVKVGYSAELRDDAKPDAGVWRGKVTRLGDAFLITRALLPPRFSFSVDETPTLEGIVTLDDGQPPLRVGQRLRVSIRPTER